MDVPVRRMDVPVRIEEASYFRIRCKQRWEWVHGSKPVTLVRWQAGKAVNASRFPCASPSAKAEGSADFLWGFDTTLDLA